MVAGGGEHSLFHQLGCLCTGSFDQLADFQFTATASDNLGQPLVGTSVCEVTTLNTVFPGFLLATNLLSDIHGISFVNVTLTQKVWKRMVKYCMYINLGICCTCDTPLLQIYVSYQNNARDF